MSIECNIAGSSYYFTNWQECQRVCQQLGNGEIVLNESPAEVDENVSAVYTCPVTIEPHSFGQYVIENYLPLREAVLANPKLSAALETEDYAGLNQREVAVLDRYYDFADLLVDVAIELFEAAYVNEESLEFAVDAWVNFNQQLQLNEIFSDNATINLLRSLADPLLDSFPRDRKLLYRIAFADRETYQSLLPELNQRIVYFRRQKTILAAENRDASAIDSFFDACRVVFGENYNYVLLNALRDNLPRVLTGMRPEEIPHLLAADEERLDAAAAAIGIELRRYPIDSPHRVLLRKRLFDLRTVAYVRGYQLGLRSAMRTFRGLQQEDVIHLEYLLRLSSEEEIEENRDEFIQTAHYFYDEWLNSEPGSLERFSLERALERIYHLAPRYGFSPTAVRAMLEFEQTVQGVAQEDSLQRITLEEWRTRIELNREVFTLTPEELPPELIEMLDHTGYYDFVRENIREITVSPYMNRVGSEYLLNAAGLAFPSVNTIHIAGADKNGNLMTLHRVAGLLVHEASHNYFYWNVNNAGEQWSLPDERQAFIRELDFMEAYLEHRLQRQEIEVYSRDAIGLSSYIVQIEKSVRATNLSLGYDEDNFDPDYFDQTVIDGGGYPTYLASRFVDSRFEEILGLLDFNPTEKSFLEYLFNPILAGQARLQGRFSHYYTARFEYQIRNINLALVRGREDLEELYPPEVYLVNEFFTQLLNRSFNHFPDSRATNYMGLDYARHLAQENLRGSADYSLRNLELILAILEGGEVVGQSMTFHFTFTTNEFHDMLSSFLLSYDVSQYLVEREQAITGF